MEDKPLWLRKLLDTIGIKSIFAFIIGVPAMIAFIMSIWAGLSPNERIIAITSGTILLIAVILFIYDRTRKVLLVIPNMLQKIHDITFEDAMNIDVEATGVEDNFERMIGLLDMDLSEFAGKSKDPTSNQIEIAYEKAQDMAASSEQKAERIINLLVKYSGLNDVLTKDKRYTVTVSRLDKVRKLIPTEEISSNVNEYLRKVEIMGSLLPVIQHITTARYGGVLKMEADFAGIENKIKDGMLTQLSKVRQSILQYYKGNNKNRG